MTTQLAGAKVEGLQQQQQQQQQLGKTEQQFHDKSVMKVSAHTAPKGELGQKYLASGIHIGMRLWENERPGAPGSHHGSLPVISSFNLHLNMFANLYQPVYFNLHRGAADHHTRLRMLGVRD